MIMSHEMKSIINRRRLSSESKYLEEAHVSQERVRGLV